MLTRKSSQFFIIVLITAISAVLIFKDINIPIVRPLLTIFLIAAVGHTTILAWAPGLALRDVVRALMTIMLGITITTIGGLVLNATPWGLGSHSWVAFISAVILLNIVIALVRKQPVSSGVPLTSVQTWRLDFKLGQILLLGLAVLMTAGAIMLARNGVINQSRPSFSQLWLVADAKATASSAMIGIRNEEHQVLEYRLVVTQGGTIIQEYPPISLGADEVWQDTLDLSSITSTTEPVEAVLYRADNPDEPYRTVNLWLQ